MTEKRLFGIVKGHREHIADHTGRLYSDSEVADLLNELNDENQELKQLIKKMGELGGFNKHMIKTICEGLE